MEKELFLKFTELENIFFLWDRTILQKDELIISIVALMNF